MNDFIPAHKALVDWAEKMPDREFLCQPVNGEIRTHTFAESEDATRRIAAALLGLGLAPGDKVAILAKNSAEWILADIAIAMAGMISVPIYPTAGPDTISYVIGHAEARAIFIGKLDEPDIVGKVVPSSMVSIAFPYGIDGCSHDWEALADRFEPLQSLHEPEPAETMSILYTSGSTGKPKGVVMSYGAYHYASCAAKNIVDIHPDDRMFSYLPLSHVTERTVTAGPAIYAGARCSFVESLKSFPHDLRTARPTLFLSVPRLWVKFQSGIHSKIPPGKLKILLAIPVVRHIVSKRIRAGMGLDECRSFGSGSAPISPLTLRWYMKVGINIGEGWGMTETSGASCTNTPFRADLVGTIGAPLPGTEMKVSDEGELLIRSPGLFTRILQATRTYPRSHDRGRIFPHRRQGGIRRTT